MKGRGSRRQLIRDQFLDDHASAPLWGLSGGLLLLCSLVLVVGGRRRGPL